MSRTGKKRYVCSFLKKDRTGKIKPNVVVIAATNDVTAKVILCQQEDIPSLMLSGKEQYERDKEGIKRIRLCETNTYEGESEDENFINNPEL